jgi:hypothetical protein
VRGWLDRLPTGFEGFRVRRCMFPALCKAEVNVSAQYVQRFDVLLAALGWISHGSLCNIKAEDAFFSAG